MRRKTKAKGIKKPLYLIDSVGKRALESDEADESAMEIDDIEAIKRAKLIESGLKLDALQPYNIYGVGREDGIIYGLYDPIKKELIYPYRKYGSEYRDILGNEPLSKFDRFYPIEDKTDYNTGWENIKSRIVKNVGVLKVTDAHKEIFAKQLEYVYSLPETVQRSLNPEERDYRSIWPILRGVEGTEYAYEHINNIDAAFENVPPLEQDIVTYRSVKVETEDDIYEKAIEDINVVGVTGKFFYDRAYVSTSLYMEYSLNFQEFLDENKCCFLIITIPKGSKVLLLPATLNTQFEVLLNRGALFKKTSSFTIGGQIRGFYLDYIKSIPDDISDPVFDFNVFSTVDVPNILTSIKGPYYIMGGKCFNAYFKNKTETDDWDLTMDEKEKQELISKLKIYTARKQLILNIHEYEEFNVTQIGFTEFEDDKNKKFIIDIHNKVVKDFTELPSPVLVITGAKKKGPVLVETTGRKTADILLKFMTMQMFVEDIIQTYDDRVNKYAETTHFKNKYLKTRDRIYEVLNISSDNLSVSYQVHLLNQCKNTLRSSAQLIPLFKLSDACYAVFNCGTVEVEKNTSMCVEENPLHEKILVEEEKRIKEKRQRKLAIRREEKAYSLLLLNTELAAIEFEKKKNKIDARTKETLDRMPLNDRKKELLRLGPSWFIKMYEKIQDSEEEIYLQMKKLGIEINDSTFYAYAEDLNKKNEINNYQLTHGYFKLKEAYNYLENSNTDSGVTIVMVDSDTDFENPIYVKKTDKVFELVKINNSINIAYLQNGVRTELCTGSIDCFEDITKLYFLFLKREGLPDLHSVYKLSEIISLDTVKERILFNSTLVPTSAEDVSDVRSYLVQKVHQIKQQRYTYDDSIVVYFVGPNRLTPGYNSMYYTLIFNDKIISTTPFRDDDHVSGQIRNNDDSTYFSIINYDMYNKRKFYLSPYMDYKTNYNWFYNGLITKLSVSDKFKDLGSKRTKSNQTKINSKRGRRASKRKSVKKSKKNQKKSFKEPAKDAVRKSRRRSNRQITTKKSMRNAPAKNAVRKSARRTARKTTIKKSVRRAGVRRSASLRRKSSKKATKRRQTKTRSKNKSCRKIKKSLWCVKKW